LHNRSSTINLKSRCATTRTAGLATGPGGKKKRKKEEEGQGKKERKKNNVPHFLLKT
jgi:hypothetical protein